MKTSFLRFYASLLVATAMLFLTPPLFATDWSGYDYLGDGAGGGAYSNKYKLAPAEGQSVVNIQSPGWATEAGIYTTFTNPIKYCSLGTGNYNIDGGGMVLHLSAFTAKETEVLVIANHQQYIFYVYYEDGIGTSTLDAVVPSRIEDTNFALESNGGYATATSGTAYHAIDGTQGSSWESTQGIDAQTLTIDLGQKRIFNTVQLRWETAYGKTFDIDVSNDGESWTTVKSVDESLEGFPHEQTLEFSEQTARYVRFNGIKRGTQWGYNLYEMRVLLPGAPVLTTIDLSATAAIAQVGGAGVALTAATKDQNGQAMSEEVSYEITPSTAGHMSGNTYISDQAGKKATIVAYNGEIRSNAVTIVGYVGTNLALNNALEDGNGGFVGTYYNANTPAMAVDNNTGSMWQGSTTNGNINDSREYDAWFVVDLKGNYMLQLVTIFFEGACSDAYKLYVSTDNENWVEAYSFAKNIGQSEHTDYITIDDLNNADNVRYVKFHSTKASTGYGMKIRELQVFGAEVSTTKTVSASVLPAATGSVTVKAGGVDVTEVEENTEVTFTATPAEGYQFVNWTKAGVEVSTSATYVTTITGNTSLVANFDYARTTYCHTPVYTNQGKKVYLTVGKGDTDGTYQIVIEGSEELTITGIYNANTAMNYIKFGTYDGNDVPLTIENGGWTYSSVGYGVITSAEIRPRTGYTWRDMWMWRPDLAFNEGVLHNINSILSQQNHFNWNSTCSDDEAPVLAAPTAAALNTTDVRLTLSATDNWDGLITYNINYKPTGDAGAGVDVEVTGASGETITRDITGLTTNTEYTFTVTASDGTNSSAARSCTATPAGDIAAPTGLTITPQALSTNAVRLTLFANDDYAGDITYNITYDNAGAANTSAARGESTTLDITGLTADTEYHFSVTATDAADNTSAAVNASIRTFASNLALNKPTEAGAIALPKAESNDGNKNSRWASGGTAANHGNIETTADWWYVDLGSVYDIANIRMYWEGARPSKYRFYTSYDAVTWTQIADILQSPRVGNTDEQVNDYVNNIAANSQGRYVKVLAYEDKNNNWAYGISFWEFEAYGSPAVDAVAPVITSFTAAGASPTSVLVQATADDNFKGNLTYTFYCNNVQQGEPVVKAAGEEATCTVTGLSMGTNYNFKVTVSDGSNTTTSDVVVASPVGDTEAPTSVTVATQSVTDNTIVLRLTAIDDLGGIIYYTVTSGSTVKNVEAVSGNNVDVTFDGLNYSTTYNFSVVAKDGADNASAAVAHSETTLRAPYPTSAAPTPATHSSLVVPVYSSAFNKNCNFADWGGSTVIKETYGAKKNNYAASYFGIVDFGTISVTADAELYLSVWTNENIRFRIVPIIHNDAETANLPERGAYTQTLTGGEWNIVHIRLGDFNLNNNTVAEPNENYNKIYQIKIDNAGNQTFWLDNIYFAKEPPVLALDETSDNSDVISENNDKYVNVTLNRSFTNTEMTYTLCLPFDMSAEQLTEAFGAGWRLSKLSEDSYYKSGDAIRMIFDRASSLEAGVPYLFTPGTSTAAPVGIEGVVINSAAPDAIGNNVVKMKGFYEPTALPDDGKDNWFLGTDNYLHKASVSAYSFRAFFTLGSGAPAGVPARVVMRGDNANTATDISNVEQQNNVEKFFRDGQLLIRCNGGVYTMLGVRVE